MKRTLLRSNLLMFILLLVLVKAQGSNIAITSSGIAVSTQGASGGLLTRLTTTEQASVEHDLPSGITSLDDVSIDADNESLVFALSFTDAQVCSFLNNEGALTLVNCVGSGFAVAPFSGVSARGGTLVISGGTGGLTVYSYNVNTGAIEEVPSIQNQSLEGVIGHPDVLMLDPATTALSTDFSGGGSRFGTMIVSLSETTATTLRDFRVEDSLGFNLVEAGPTNFPLVNALYETSNGSFMYTANGAMTVQDPFVDGGVTTISGAPDGFQAVTVAVNAERQLVVFGGLVNGSISQVVVFDISADPLSPTLVSTTNVNGRITSVASSGDVVAYVTLPNPGTDINLLDVMGTNPGPTSPPDGQPTSPPAQGPTEPPAGVPTMAPMTSSGQNTAANALYVFFAGFAGLAWIFL